MHVLKRHNTTTTTFNHRRTMSISDDLNYDLEYRSKEDDAWYTCGVILEHETQILRVKFKDFVQSSNDELFSISDLSTHHDIQIFLRRFRPESQPINDNECSRVTQGFMVCAAYSRDKQMRYFDAIVDAVCIASHL